MKRFARDNGLSLGFGLIFLVTLAGQAFAGAADYNAQRSAHALPGISVVEYLTSSTFATDVAENWQSEYLQFLLYVLATAWLVQRGSPESKDLGQEGPQSDEDELLGRHAVEGSPRAAVVGGLVSAVYSRSLGLLMGLVFVLAWLAQSIAGRANFNQEQLADLQEPVSWAAYLTEPDFWNRTLQNWQSEFLAVGSMAIFSVFLRQRGSAESKPVGAPHEATGVEN